MIQNDEPMLSMQTDVTSYVHVSHVNQWQNRQLKN